MDNRGQKSGWMMEYSGGWFFTAFIALKRMKSASNSPGHGLCNGFVLSESVKQ